VHELREPARNPVEWFRKTFDDSVKLRRISDVPVGVLLSGGLDSSCVASSLGVQRAKDIVSFTVRFRENEYDEGLLARQVAGKYKLNYQELVVGEDKLLELIQQCSWLNDEPLVHANDMHRYAIAKFAKPLVTVLLSGEGADETLGGYVRYGPLLYHPAMARLHPLLRNVAKMIPHGLAGSLASRLHKLNRFLQMRIVDNFVLFNACDVLPADLEVLGLQPSDDFYFRRQLLTEAKKLYPGEPFRQAMCLDQHTFLSSLLDRNDRTTMGASIECRVPFLDYRLVEGLAAMPSSVLLKGKGSKPLLRRAFGDRLPRAILHHRKWGFGVPWQKYFTERPDFRESIANLADQPPVCDGPLDCAKVKQMTENYLRGDTTQHAIIRQLFFISAWHRACVKSSPGSGQPT
jgi:asparagine synthase (glutamine-hydrolysing)